MSFLFNGCNKLKEIKGIDKFKTSKVNTLIGMFQGCHEIQFLNLSSFDTSNIDNMSGIFNECYKLTEIKGIDKFNTTKVISMKLMFQKCKEIEYLNLTSFDTSNVIDMSAMFNECNKLKEIKGIDKFNTDKVITMKAMFQQCYEIEDLNLSNFDTSNVNDLSIMFQECFNLNYIDISNFSTTNVKNIRWMFNKCYKLKEIKGIDILINIKNIDKTGVFEDCNRLKNIPSNIQTHPIKIDKKQISVFFISNDQSIKNYRVTCYNTDIFETLREKIYIIKPEFKNKEFYFLANGNIINERVSLAENNIGDGTVILIQEEF